MVILLIIIQSNWLMFFGFKFILDAIVIALGGKLFEKHFDPLVYCLWAIAQPFYILLVGLLGLRDRFFWKP